MGGRESRWKVGQQLSNWLGWLLQLKATCLNYNVSAPSFYYCYFFLFHLFSHSRYHSTYILVSVCLYVFFAFGIIILSLCLSICKVCTFIFKGDLTFYHVIFSRFLSSFFSFFLFFFLSFFLSLVSLFLSPPLLFFVSFYLFSSFFYLISLFLSVLENPHVFKLLKHLQAVVFLCCQDRKNGISRCFICLNR